MTELNSKQIHILQVAETLFAERGFDGTSIRDISKVAKINIAMVSYYFGSKERLLESLVFYRTSDLKIQLANLTKEHFSPLEKINKLIELYIAKIHGNKYIYQILHLESFFKKRELNFKSFTEIKKANLESLKAIIEEGQSQGIFRKNINIPLIAPTIFGTYVHFQMSKPFFGDILNLKTELDYDTYIKTELTAHIQQTINALLLYEG